MTPTTPDGWRPTGAGRVEVESRRSRVGDLPLKGLTGHSNLSDRGSSDAMLIAALASLQADPALRPARVTARRRVLFRPGDDQIGALCMLRFEPGLKRHADPGGARFEPDSITQNSFYASDMWERIPSSRD